MKVIKQFFAAAIAFLTSTGFAYLGYGGGAIGVFVFFPKTWFWGSIFGLFIGLFCMKNAELLKPWANKQIEDIKDKLGL